MSIAKKSVKKTTVARFEEVERWVKVGADGQPVGEPKEVNVLVKEISRSGFAITYLSELVRLIDTIGNKKMKVVKFILKNMDSENKLVMTTYEISDKCGVSRVVVSETLKLLEQVGFIARKTGCVMLSPKIVHKGNAQRERFLMTKFYQIADSEMSAPADEND